MCAGIRVKKVLFDADGVLLDSSHSAWAAARDILSLFGEPPTVDDEETYRHHFGRNAQVLLAGEDGAPALRAIHRVLMRHRCEGVRPFADVIEVVKKLTVPVAIITGAYADGVRRSLGDAAPIFRDIAGRESGSKAELLAERAAGGKAIYVCDTVKDVVLCQSLRVPCVAVTWGYEGAAHLAPSRPDYLVGSVDEFAHLLRHLGAIRDYGGG